MNEFEDLWIKRTCLNKERFEQIEKLIKNTKNLEK